MIKDKNKKVVFAIVGVVFLIAFGFIFSSYNPLHENEKTSTVSQGELIILNETDKDVINQFARDYIKDKFDSMTEERKIEYVDKMYFSTCYEVSDFCASGNYSELQGCSYCEGR